MALVVAQDADRITRDPGHRMLLDEEFDRRGCRLKALDDWGDESHEGQFLKFLRGWVSKGERLKIAERTRRGRRQKSKQGLLVAPSTVPYGFRLNEARDGYLVNDEKMAVVRRMFQMVTDGAGLYHVKRTLEAEAVPAPGGGERWNRSTLREFLKRDTYFPHTFAEVERLVAPHVTARLERDLNYGIAWASRHDWKVLGRERRLDGTYRDVREHAEKPREEWIALPVPDSGIPREAYIEGAAQPGAQAPRAEGRETRLGAFGWFRDVRRVRARHVRPHGRAEGSQAGAVPLLSVHAQE